MCTEILESRREEVRLSKAYEKKVDVINVITAPEIEMLIIHSEGAYERFKRSGKKPSEFCKSDLRTVLLIQSKSSRPL